MKFFVVDNDNDMRRVKGAYTQILNDAKQYSFKEAREICESFNGNIRNTRGVYKSMIPVPKVVESKPDVEAKYYIVYGDEYYLAPGEGRTDNKKDAYHYDHKKAEYICRGDSSLTMEKVNEKDS